MTKAKTTTGEDDGRDRIRRARLEWIAEVLSRPLRWPFTGSRWHG